MSTAFATAARVAPWRFTCELVSENVQRTYHVIDHDAGDRVVATVYNEPQADVLVDVLTLFTDATIGQAEREEAFDRLDAKHQRTVLLYLASLHDGFVKQEAEGTRWFELNGGVVRASRLIVGGKEVFVDVRYYAAATFDYGTVPDGLAVAIDAGKATPII